MGTAQLDNSFWNNRRVLMTGHTGFKGSWMALWLSDMGANVVGLAHENNDQQSLFSEAMVGHAIDSRIGDIRDVALVREILDQHRPSVVLHLAAQALVRESYDNPIETYSTNVVGTATVMNEARKTPGVASLVSVTSDKCYENVEKLAGYVETDPMGGHDPYSSSKGCAELVTSSMARSYFSGPGTANVASARAGNVIGGGDTSVDRLICDIVRAVDAGEQLVVRNPSATRPWQHVLEPLGGYLLLAQRLVEDAQYVGGWNFGPSFDDCRTVETVVEAVGALWPAFRGWELADGAQPHEAQSLRLDCTKAESKLGWVPTYGFDGAIEKTVAWYQAQRASVDIAAFTHEQIALYHQSRPEFHKQ